MIAMGASPYKILLVLALFCCCIAVASANIETGNITVTPSGDLVSGETNVTISYQVDFIESNGETFPAGDVLVMNTELDNAKWTYSLVQDGVNNPRPSQTGKNLYLSGWELSYSKSSLMLSVKVNGIAPMVPTTQKVKILRVAELTGSNKVLTGSETIVERTVNNPVEIQGSISLAKDQLKKLKEEIDQRSAEGIDVSEAEAMYNKAVKSVKSADGATFNEAKTYLTNAQTQISDGRALLGKGAASKVINDVRPTIDEVDGYITYFEVNRSMSKDPRVQNIRIKRDAAAELLSQANDEISQGKYDDAISRAEDASSKAQGVLSDAQSLKKEIGEESPTNVIGGGFGSITGTIMKVLPYIAAVIIVLVIIFIAIKLYKRRKADKWDELY